MRYRASNSFSALFALVVGLEREGECVNKHGPCIERTFLSFNASYSWADQCDTTMTIDVLEKRTYVIGILVGSLRLIEETEWSNLDKTVSASVGRAVSVCLYLSGALLLQLHAFLLQTVDERFELVALVFQRFEFIDQDGECFALAVEFLLQDLNLNGGRDARALVDCAR